MYPKLNFKVVSIMCRTRVFLLISFCCPTCVLICFYLTVFVIIQVLYLMKLMEIFWVPANWQHASIALNYPEGNRYARLGLGVRWFTQAGSVHLASSLLERQGGKCVGKMTVSVWELCLCIMFYKEFKCFLVKLMNNHVDEAWLTFPDYWNH